MLGVTHSLSGGVVGLAAAAAADLPLPGVALFVAIGWYSALLPDVDHPAAPAANVLGPVSWLACRFWRWLSVVTTGNAHRGITHGVLFAAGWAVLVAFLSAYVLDLTPALYAGLAAGLGVLTHLAGDLVTKSSLRHVLWPLPVQVPVPRRWRIRTGGTAERWIATGLSVSGVLLLPAALS